MKYLLTFLISTSAFAEMTPAPTLTTPSLSTPTLDDKKGSTNVTSEFCKGFIQGYNSVRGGSSTAPNCPKEPTIPNGSTPYQEGLREGIRVAR